jgi:hypothetical protein
MTIRKLIPAALVALGATIATTGAWAQDWWSGPYAQRSYYDPRGPGYDDGGFPIYGGPFYARAPGIGVDFSFGGPFAGGGVYSTPYYGAYRYNRPYYDDWRGGYRGYGYRGYGWDDSSYNGRYDIFARPCYKRSRVGRNMCASYSYY